MKIKTLIIAIMLLSVNMVFAAPFQNVKKILTQPDGTELHCYASGDEFYSRLHDADGFTIVQAENGYFVYATADINGNVVATQHIAGKTDPKSLGLTPNIAISQEEYQKKRKAMEVNNRVSSKDSSLNHGVYNNIVVFIKFKGDNDLSTTKTEIDSMFNYDGYYDISMNNYFKKATYNQLSMVSYCYPLPEGDKIIAYEDIYPRNYYQPYNETTNPEGYTNQADREFPLLKRAIEFIDDMVPDTLNVDRDNDGYVDNVIFVVKGNVGDWSDLLWPHMWTLYGEKAYINGKRVGTFNFQLETSTYFSVSTLCHEMSHSLGFPDLYHYVSGTDHLSPSGPWDLMCGNSHPPQHSSTYMKHKYGTWIDDIPVIDYGTYTIEANSWEGGRRNCYMIPSSHPKQFYMLEYRNKNNMFEKGLPNGGLLIYRIDTRFHGCADYNGYDTFDEVYIFRPGGSATKNGQINEAAFCQEEGKTTFNYSTNPYPFLNKSQDDLMFNICNISARDEQMTFTYCPVDIESVPQNLTVNVDVNNNKVELKWDVNELASSYNVYRDDSLIANVSENYFDDIYDSSLAGYHKYYITSISADEESYRSNEKDVILGNYSVYNIVMKTTGENGWQGGEIVASFDNGMKEQYFTIYTGLEREMQIVAPEGTKVTLSWNTSWDNTECSFIVTNEKETVYTSSELQEGLLTEFVATSEGLCATPEDIKINSDGNNVMLTWNSTVECNNYTIIRDGEVIAENIMTNHYIDNEISASGTYQYCVMSVRGDYVSNPSDVVSICIMKFNFTPITLESEIDGNDVTLNWSAPSANDNVLRYDNGVYVTNEGSSSHNWGIKIPAESLKLFDNSNITSLEIFDASNATYTFKIYNGETNNNDLIHTEEYKGTNVNDFVRFNLSEAVDIDSNKDLWITVKGVGNNPIPCGEFCGNPNSSLLKAGIQWRPASDYGLNYSWMIRAYTSANENLNEGMTYNIYRDNSLIASELTSSTYVDKDIKGEVCYKVEAIYANSMISESEELCVKTYNFEDAIFPGFTHDFINVVAKDIVNVKLINMTGAVVYNIDTNAQELKIDVRDLESGTYVVQVITKTDIITEKVVVVI